MAGKKQTKSKVVVLPSGEKILHEPPSEWYPSGKKILIKEGSPVRDMLLDQMEDLKAQHQEIHQRNADAIPGGVLLIQEIGLSRCWIP